MKNFLLFFSVLITSLLLTACESGDRYDTMMDDDNSMMNHDTGGEMMLASDEDFISMMIPHHQEAIDTSKITLEKSTNAELKALAQNIIDAQTAEIAKMEAWGAEWFGTSFKASDDYMAMMSDLSDLEADELDQTYIAGMIEHHEGAIMMAEQIKEITERSELLELADAIIESQTNEVTLLKSWLE
ncbi:MAG: DUF305 domain-containing protein [Patescibacteria group bacterium]